MAKRKVGGKTAFAGITDAFLNGPPDLQPGFLDPDFGTVSPSRSAFMVIQRHNFRIAVILVDARVAYATIGAARRRPGGLTAAASVRVPGGSDSNAGPCWQPAFMGARRHRSAGCGLLGILQIPGEIMRGSIAILGISCQSPKENILHALRNFRIDLARQRRIVLQSCVHDNQGIVTLKRNLPGQHLVEHYAHGINIAAAIAAFTIAPARAKCNRECPWSATACRT